MSDIIRIWIETTHNAAFRSGGWAYVLAEGRALLGAAGGERTASPERVALAGLVEALKAAPAGFRVEIQSASPLVVGASRRLAAAAAGETPDEDLDLWAQLTTALKDRPASFTKIASAPKTPTAFAAAWADLARDKVKNGGAFRASIPKTNLVKAGVPA
jgi:ribonuclease HI